MDVELETFDKSMFSLKTKTLIIGGEDQELLTKVILELKELYMYGSGISINPRKLEKIIGTNSVYSRYSSLLDKRLFQENIYFILDNYIPFYEKIHSNIRGKNLAMIDNFDSVPDKKETYDYIFVNTTNKELLEKIHSTIPKGVSFESFSYLVSVLKEDSEILVIDTKNNAFLFFS